MQTLELKGHFMPRGYKHRAIKNAKCFLLSTNKSHHFLFITQHKTIEVHKLPGKKIGLNG